MEQNKKELNRQIGARIKAAREQAGVTQEKLAETIDVSTQYISDLERGKVGASTQTITRISQTLRVSCDYLLLGTSQSKDVSAILNMLKPLSDKQLSIVYNVLRSLLPAFK